MEERIYFDEPQTIYDTLEQYHKDHKTYHLVKKLVNRKTHESKPWLMKNIGNSDFTSKWDIPLDNFEGIHVEDLDNIFIESWGPKDIHLVTSYIEGYYEKIKKGDKRYKNRHEVQKQQKKENGTKNSQKNKMRENLKYDL